MRGEHRPPPPEPTPFVSREEFEIYDGIKTMAALSFFFFAKMIALGKCGKRATWRQKSWATNKMMRKSCFVFVLLMIVGIFIGFQGKHLKHIVKKVHRAEKEKMHAMQGDENMPKFEEPESELYDEEEMGPGRNLRSYAAHLRHQFYLGGSSCDGLSETACHSNKACSWCKCAAVPSACHSVEDAKGLPDAVF